MQPAPCFCVDCSAPQWSWPRVLTILRPHELVGALIDRWPHSVSPISLAALTCEHTPFTCALATFVRRGRLLPARPTCLLLRSARCPPAPLLAILLCPVRVARHTTPPSHSVSPRRHWLMKAPYFLSRRGLPAPTTSPTRSLSCRSPVQAAHERSPSSRPTGFAPRRLASTPLSKLITFRSVSFYSSPLPSDDVGRVVRL